MLKNGWKYKKAYHNNNFTFVCMYVLYPNESHGHIRLF